MSFFENTLLAAMTSTQALSAIFDERATLQLWFDIEAALARAQALHGLVPMDAAIEIERNARLDRFDVPTIFAEVLRIDHPLVPLLRALANACGPAGAWVHWGVTTQDIVDTGLVLQLKQAWPLLRADLAGIETELARLAYLHRDTLMAGRTHGQQALPITFGFKLAVFVTEFRRHAQRLDALEPRLMVGQLGGAVGTLAGLGPKALAIQRDMLGALGLGIPDICWHTARDVLAELVCCAGLIGATAGKLAREIAVLQATEVAELEEPFPIGNVGSSTMPHKRNPVRSEAVIAAAVLLRETVPTMLLAMAHEHERDGTAWNVELEAVPRAVCLLAAVLSSTRGILAGLSVRPERMRSNLDAFGGLALSEAVMLALAERVGRGQAHDVVYDAAMRAQGEGIPFRRALLDDARVAPYITPNELERLLVPESYLGLAAPFVDRVVGHGAGR